MLKELLQVARIGNLSKFNVCKTFVFRNYSMNNSLYENELLENLCFGIKSYLFSDIRLSDHSVDNFCLFDVHIGK